MKIVTWNIREDERNESGRLNIDSYNYIVDFIKKEKITVICLHETNNFRFNINKIQWQIRVFMF